MAKQQEELVIGGRTIAFSNGDKVLYPGSGFTKKQVLDYYLRVSKYLLPHLKNRPITMKRFPDGVRGKFFYEKNAPRFTPGVDRDHRSACGAGTTRRSATSS